MSWECPPRTTKPGSRDDHQDTGRHLTPAAPSFLGPALRARGNRLKSPKNPRLPLHDPGVRAPARLGGGESGVSGGFRRRPLPWLSFEVSEDVPPALVEVNLIGDALVYCVLLGAGGSSKCPWIWEKLSESTAR